MVGTHFLKFEFLLPDCHINANNSEIIVNTIISIIQINLH
jgi:hypothetical protein